LALSDFWHELAIKFRGLDPTRCLRFQWISFPTEKRWESHVIGTGDACRTIKVQFEALATRAGMKLTSPSIGSSGLLGWLEAVQQFAGNDRPSEGIHTDDAGVTHQFIGGTIMHLCEVSADLCSALEVRALESAEDPYTAVLESLVAMPSSESRTRLSAEAQNRIRRAHIESEKFRWEAESLIESQHLLLDGQAAASERNKGNLQAARWVLSALRTEYSIFSEDEYRDYMKQEIEGAANSLELYDSQRRLLEIEFYYPEPNTKPLQNAPQNTQPGLEDRTVLRDRYLGSFPEKIKILDICWAANEHYREWKRWLQKDSPTKNGSKSDLAFRQILNSGKRPIEYRPIERPPGWQ
jgi:hypothetical protein